MFDVVASYRCMQFKGKLMNWTWENGKKSNFGPDFGSFGLNFGHHIFFFKNLVLSVTRYNGQLSLRTISGKNNDLILTNLVTDRRTDGRDWFHRMLRDWRQASKIKMYQPFGLWGSDGYVEISEKLDGHGQLVEWKLFSSFKSLARKKTTTWQKINFFKIHQVIHHSKDNFIMIKNNYELWCDNQPGKHYGQ